MGDHLAMSAPIRILHVIGIMNRGGAETMIMNLYRHIDRSKVQFDFVQNENEGAAFDEEIRELGGNIYHCPRFKGVNCIQYVRWWKQFFDQHHEYAIVHGHIGSTASFYLNEARKHGILTIAHSHNTNSRTVKQFFFSILAYPTRFIADYLFMCSRQAGIDRFGEKAVLDDNRAFFFPNAIDTEMFQYSNSSRENIRREFGVSDKELLIGHVGRFAKQKNHAFLLDIFKKISEKKPDAKLLLVGDGDLRQEIKGKIDLLGLKDRVIMTGVRSDVNDLMSAMDVMLFPSLFEGLPVTLVEAQCNGLPCVISDKVPSDSIIMKELVKVCSLEDDLSVWTEAVENTDKNDRTRYAEEMKKTEFDIEKSAKWLEDFYCEKAR